jgi:hypothetical protein
VSRASNTIARAGKRAIKLTEKAVAAVKTKVTKKQKGASSFLFLS